MQKLKKEHKPFKKLYDIITFVNLPIQKKFALFAVGVLIWFIIMYTISIWTMIDINRNVHEITHHDIPYAGLSKNIVLKLEKMQNDITEINAATNRSDVIKKADVSRRRLEDVVTILNTLKLGGVITNFLRDDNTVMETFNVDPIKDREVIDTYIDPLLGKTEEFRGALDEISRLKVSLIRGEQARSTEYRKLISGFQALLVSTSTLSREFAVKVASLYEGSAHEIRFAIRCTTSTATIVILIASALLAVFTFWIARSISNPVRSISDQILSLGQGEVDLNQRIRIESEDEIGTLSHNFNTLMEEISGMAMFKKVIEEDENIEDVYTRIGSVFHNVLGLNDFILYEVSNSQNKMKPVNPIILDPDDINCYPDILDNCSLCRAKKTGHAVSSLEFPDICKQFRSDLAATHSHVCIPMIIGGSAGGVVQFIFEKATADPEEVDLKMYKAGQYLKESLAVIEAKRLMNTLRESALKDSLTGLYNRRFLQEYTETLVSGIQRRGKTIGLIMCDLDYFKQVNDVYGHNIGDSVLKETAEILKKNARAADLVIRFGGEEFLIILLDVNEGDAMSVAEKIRTTVEESKIRVPDGIIKKTISLGISEFPVDSQGFWQAIKYADVALYKAKEMGRNKSIRFTPDMWQEDQF